MKSIRKLLLSLLAAIVLMCGFIIAKGTGVFTVALAVNTTDTTPPTCELSSTDEQKETQILTITLSDDVKVKGYYFGTSADYLQNNYTLSDNSSVDESISAAGTYFVTVEDTAGNVSETKTITYYKASFYKNYYSGPISLPSTVFPNSGFLYSVILPAETSITPKVTSLPDGYVFKGWSLEKNAKEGQYKITVTENNKWYAIWTDIKAPRCSIGRLIFVSGNISINATDNDELAGCYWDKNSDYLKNTYVKYDPIKDKQRLVEDGWGAFSFTVKESGVYYATVVDVSGNVSETISVTIHRVNLKSRYGAIACDHIFAIDNTEYEFTTPSRANKNYTYIGWSKDSGATTGVKKITVTSDATYYAIWKFSNSNLYNRGEESYKFDNFRDSDSAGHCFGMAVTSAFYYSGILDPKDIGISSAKNLYTVSNSTKVRKSICKYQAIQSGYVGYAVVAGYNDSGKNYTKDWDEVIKYVKNHAYDDKGLLTVSFGKEGANVGHATNFLRYKEVNGQQRIYIYDNNFPTTDCYLYKASNGKIYEAPNSTFGTSLRYVYLMDVEKYYERAVNYAKSLTVYAKSNAIAISGIEPSEMLCGDAEAYVAFDIPANKKEITITPLSENAEFTYMDQTFRFGSIDGNVTGILKIAESDENAESVELIINEPHGHKYSEWVITNQPTCTENGIKEKTCMYCFEKEKEAVDAKGHHDLNKDAACDDCGFDMPIDTTKCSCNCHKSGFTAFIWKMLNVFNKLLKKNQICTCGVKHY